MKISKMERKQLDRACEMLENARDVFPALDSGGFRRTLERNLSRGTVLAAEEDGILAGFLVYSPVLAQISFLLVDKGFRKRGVGEALLRRAIELLNADEIIVETYCAEVACAAPARALYHKLGFVDGERLEGYAIPQQRLTWRK